MAPKPEAARLAYVFGIFLAVAACFAGAQALAQNAYITNSGVPPDFFGTVSVIDTTSNTVTATIPVGIAPFGVAVTPPFYAALVLDRKKLAAFSAAAGRFLRSPIGDRRCNRTRASVGNAGGNARPSLTNARDIRYFLALIGHGNRGVARTFELSARGGALTREGHKAHEPQLVAFVPPRHVALFVL